MPHLKYGSKYYRFSSDELWFPGFCSILSRIVWLILCIIIISFSSYNFSLCSYGILILIYLSLTIFIILATLSCEIIITSISIKYTMSENSKRDVLLPYYITTRLFLAFVQFCIAVFGSVLLAIHLSSPTTSISMSLYPCYHNPHVYPKNDSTSVEHFDFMVITFILICQYLETFTLSCCCLFFNTYAAEESDFCVIKKQQQYINLTNNNVVNNNNSNILNKEKRKARYHQVAYSEDEIEDDGRSIDNDSDRSLTNIASTSPLNSYLSRQDLNNNNDINTTTNNSIWSNRCFYLCKLFQYSSCSMFGGTSINRHGTFDSITNILTEFFHTDGLLDLVVSDVAAGVILVRMEQMEIKRSAQFKQFILTQQCQNNLQGSIVDDSSFYSRNNITASNSSSSSSNSTTFNKSTSNAKEASSSDTTTSSIHRNTGDIFEPISPRALNIHNTGDQHWLENCTRYLPYALAPYSHLFALFRQPITGVCDLCKTKIKNNCFTINDNSINDNDDNDDDIKNKLFYFCYCSSCCLKSTANTNINSFTKNKSQTFRSISPTLSTSLLNNNNNSNNDDNITNTVFLQTDIDIENQNNLFVHSANTTSTNINDISSSSSCNRPSAAAYVSKTILGDNCLQLNETGMIHLVHKHSNTSKLVFASFHNDLFIKPYVIFYDSLRNTVIISIRGTLSLEDCITDVTCEAESLEQSGIIYGFDGKNKFAHKGMLQSAVHIRKQIDELGILHQLMTVNTVPPVPTPSTTSTSTSSQYRKNQNSPRYESSSLFHSPPHLVVTGHSLGGGMAILLTYLLRPQYPQTVCYAYGTPGSVLDKKSCQECQHFVNSVVLGNDIVSCLSFTSLVKLRQHILDCICRARVNKMIIIQSLLKSSFWNNTLPSRYYNNTSVHTNNPNINSNNSIYTDNDIEHNTTHNTIPTNHQANEWLRSHNTNETSASYLYKPGHEPNSSLKLSLQYFIEQSNNRLNRPEYMELSLPGRILHLKKSENNNSDHNVGRNKCFSCCSKYSNINNNTNISTTTVHDKRSNYSDTNVNNSNCNSLETTVVEVGSLGSGGTGVSNSISMNVSVLTKSVGITSSPVKYNSINTSISNNPMNYTATTDNRQNYTTNNYNNNTTHTSNSNTKIQIYNICDYVPYESYAENFRVIQITPSMGWEHFPNKYEILYKLYKNWKEQTWATTNSTNDKSY